jgi:acetyltransferase-like isoleucine patch superfamily enzyme
MAFIIGGTMLDKQKKIIKYILAFDFPLPTSVKVVYKFFYRSSVLFFELFLLIKKIVVVSPLFRSICTSVGTKLSIESLPYVRGNGNIIIGDNVKISGKIGIQLVGKNKPTLKIGNNTFIGSSSAFNLRSEIIIGNDCLIANSVFMQDNDGHPLEPISRARGDAPLSTQVNPIYIGDNVWIGRASSILKGVKIGNNAIVGAGSIVTRNVEEGTIVAGNPAKVISTVPLKK